MFNLAWQQMRKLHWLHFKLMSWGFHSRLKVDADGKPFTELKHFGSGSWVGNKMLKTLISVWLYSSTAKVCSWDETALRASTLTSHHFPLSVMFFISKLCLIPNFFLGRKLKSKPLWLVQLFKTGLKIQEI